MRVLVCGTFDRLHPGHMFLLREASQRGELFVLVARDATVLHIKGVMPEETERVRLENIRRAFPRARALLGSHRNFLAPVRAIHPDLILLGHDQCLPPGIHKADLPCPFERLPAFHPEKYKSSLRRCK